MMSSESAGKVRRQYSIATLKKLRSLESSKKWPQQLDMAFLNSEGQWDPVKSVEHSRQRPTNSQNLSYSNNSSARQVNMKGDNSNERRPSNSNTRNNSSGSGRYSGTNNGRAGGSSTKSERSLSGGHLKNNGSVSKDDQIVLGPQRRQWISGCHVSSSSGANNNASSGARSHPQVKRNKPTHERHKFREGGAPNHKHNTRRSAYENKEPDEPEWFLSGPDDVNDIIELTGISSSDKEMAAFKKPEIAEDTNTKNNFVAKNLGPFYDNEEYDNRLYDNLISSTNDNEAKKSVLEADSAIVSVQCVPKAPTRTGITSREGQKLLEKLNGFVDPSYNPSLKSSDVTDSSEDIQSLLKNILLNKYEDTETNDLKENETRYTNIPATQNVDQNVDDTKKVPLNNPQLSTGYNQLGNEICIKRSFPSDKKILTLEEIENFHLSGSGERSESLITTKLEPSQDKPSSSEAVSESINPLATKLLNGILNEPKNTSSSENAFRDPYRTDLLSNSDQLSNLTPSESWEFFQQKLLRSQEDKQRRRQIAANKFQNMQLVRHQFLNQLYGNHSIGAAVPFGISLSPNVPSFGGGINMFRPRLPLHTNHVAPADSETLANTNIPLSPDQSKVQNATISDTGGLCDSTTGGGPDGRNGPVPNTIAINTASSTTPAKRPIVKAGGMSVAPAGANSAAHVPSLGAHRPAAGQSVMRPPPPPPPGAQPMNVAAAAAAAQMLRMYRFLPPGTAAPHGHMGTGQMQGSHHLGMPPILSPPGAINPAQLAAVQQLSQLQLQQQAARHMQRIQQQQHRQQQHQFSTQTHMGSNAPVEQGSFSVQSLFEAAAAGRRGHGGSGGMPPLPGRVQTAGQLESSLIGADH